MIVGLRGTLAGKHGDLVSIATEGGLTYEVAVPLGALQRLPPIGGEARLHTVLVVREDGWTLFGFDDPTERTVFQRLLGGSGIGPRLALALVSNLGGRRLVRAVGEGDLAALCAVPGIGRKKAERMILELKDRMSDLQAGPAPADAAVPAGEQAVSALVNLGYAPGEADAAVRAVLSSDGAVDTPDLIRGALQLLTRGP